VNKSPSTWSAHKLISASEWGWVLVYAILIMALTSIPYLIAFQKTLSSNQNDAWRFSGFLFGVEDGNSYIAKMRRGMEGEWLFRSPYSGMQQKGLLAFFPYYLIGKLAGGRGTHEQLVILFHWFRIGAGVFYVFATYRFLSEYITLYFYRRVALVLITLGGGLGWLILLFGDLQVLPLEFYSPEAFGFLSLYGLPHLSLARALMLLALVEYIHIWNSDEEAMRFSHGWRLSLYWFGAGLAQPIQAGILAVIFAFHSFLEVIKQVFWGSASVKRDRLKDVIRSLFGASWLSVILLVYTAYAFLTDPYLRIWAAQNRLPSASISLYLLSYGWLLPFVLGGIYQMQGSGEEKSRLLIIWLLAVSGLIFLPISIQRRLIEGIWVVLILLATYFLESLEAGSRRQNYLRWLAGIVFLLAIPSSLLLIFGGYQGAIIPKPPIFVPQQNAVGYEALNQFEEAQDAIILASYETSNELPAYAYVRVLIGHGPESPFGDVLSKEVRAFYQTQTSVGFRQEFLQRYRVEYVIWGDNERSLGNWQPVLEPYLIPVYENEGFVIFKVDRSQMDN